MIYKHQDFQLDTEAKKVFDENGKELVLTGNAYRMLVFLCGKRHADLSEIGEYLDYAKEYNENHIRQYRYKVKTALGKSVIEYKNRMYSLVGEIEEALEVKKKYRNTDLLRHDSVESDSEAMEKVPETTKPEKFPAMAAVAMLLLSFLSWPSGFYTLLRIAVTGVAAYYAYHLHRKDGAQGSWFWTFICISVLFNPFVPIYLYDKSIWGVIDVVVAVLFVWFISRDEW